MHGGSRSFQLADIRGRYVKSPAKKRVHNNLKKSFTTLRNQLKHKPLTDEHSRATPHPTPRISLTPHAKFPNREWVMHRGRLCADRCTQLGRTMGLTTWVRGFAFSRPGKRRSTVKLDFRTNEYGLTACLLREASRRRKTAVYQIDLSGCRRHVCESVASSMTLPVRA